MMFHMDLNISYEMLGRVLENYKHYLYELDYLRYFSIHNVFRDDLNFEVLLFIILNQFHEILLNFLSIVI